MALSDIAESAESIPPLPLTERLERADIYWPGLLLAFAATSLTIGIIWDISWHSTIGRDTFWTPAHMAIYFGGALAGFAGGWLALKHTFFATPKEKNESVCILGARAPLGAWVSIWGACAMLTSAPFDNWWHNAYGLDVKIISPPHTLLGLGMFGITLGALLLVLARQNRSRDGAGSGLFIYVGGIFLTLAGVLVMEYIFPNLQHTATFYEICALTFPFRLVTLGRAGKISWPVTRVAAIYLGIECLMIWILPLFPAQPKLAPIFNPVTHMVPPPFPLLLILPALAIDFVLKKTGDTREWLRRVALAVVLGGIFLAVFLGVQWFFSEFLLSSHADNWFFAGNRFWSYGSSPGKWQTRFMNVDARNSDADLLNSSGIGISWALASFTSWLGLLLGGWMRKVVR